MDPGMNNYQMDGVAINNIANSGSSNDGTIYTGIADPQSGRHPGIQGADLDLRRQLRPQPRRATSTWSPSPAPTPFHGSAFEFLRNSVLNADDFFYPKITPAHAAPGAGPEPVRRHDRRPHQEGQAVLLLQLSGNALQERRDGLSQDLRRAIASLSRRRPQYCCLAPCAAEHSLSTRIPDSPHCIHLRLHGPEAFAHVDLALERPT